MQKQFYSHLVTPEPVFIELDKLEIAEKEKEHLKSLIESNIHIAILDIILTQIPQEDKKMFLTHLHKNDHELIWKFLEHRTIAIDKKIAKKANELLEEFLHDIHKAITA